MVDMVGLIKEVKGLFVKLIIVILFGIENFFFSICMVFNVVKLLDEKIVLGILLDLMMDFVIFWFCFIFE